MGFVVTPNMGLIQPNVLQELGPAWATDLNTSTGTIDSHDHSTGKGVKITPAGLNINTDLSYTGFGPINNSWVRFTAQTLPSPGAKPASLFVNAAGNLFYENTSGNQVQLTSAGTITPSGTGAYNGFYNFGGSGYTGSPPGTGSAQAGFYQNFGQYAFYSNTSLSLADAVFGSNVYIAGAAPTLWLQTGAAGLPSTTGGVYLDAELDPIYSVNNALGAYLDPANNGSYVRALYLNMPLATGGSPTAPGILAPVLGINAPGSAVVHAATAFTAVNTSNNIMFLDAYSPNGAPVTGFGANVVTRLANVQHALVQTTSPTQLTAATAISNVWSNATGFVGGLLMYAGNNGNFLTGASIQLSGVGTLGLLTTPGASTGSAVSVGGAMSPSTGSSFNLGSPSFPWAAAYVTSVNSSGPVDSGTGVSTFADVLSLGTVRVTGPGTVGSPALWVGTSTNGLYAPAHNQLGISTNGTLALFLDTAQNATFTASVAVTSGMAITGGGLSVVGGVLITGTLGVSSTLTVSSGGITSTGTLSNTGAGSFSSTLASTTYSSSSDATTTSQGTYNRNSFLSNFGGFASNGTVVQTFNVTGNATASGSGVYTINFPFTLSTNAVIFAYSAPDSVLFKLTSGGAGANSVTITASDATNHVFTLFVFGG